MNIKQVILPAATAVLLTSCVSSKKFKQSQAELAALQVKHTELQGNLNDCTNEKAALAAQKSKLEGDIDGLNKQIDLLKQNNTQALKQLEDLSVISSAQAESIKRSIATGAFPSTLGSAVNITRL